MTTTFADKDVVGTAIYLELARTSGGMKYVQQTLFTPEIIAPGATVPECRVGMYRRRISTATPKRTWRFWNASSTTASAMVAIGGSVGDPRTVVQAADYVLGFARGSIDSMIERTATGNRYYDIVGVPVLVEVTGADIADLKSGRTPYKVFGRVWKARKALGFPENFL